MSDDFDAMIEETRRGLNAFVKEGNADAMKTLFSRRDDVTLGNPFGPVQRGRANVEDALDRAAAQFKDGTAHYEEVSRYVTPELAYIVEVERFEAKLGGRMEASRGSLRVTMIFRREDDNWKIVHRHADPVTSPRPLESIIED